MCVCIYIYIHIYIYLIIGSQTGGSGSWHLEPVQVKDNMLLPLLLLRSSIGGTPIRMTPACVTVFFNPTPAWAATIHLWGLAWCMQYFSVTIPPAVSPIPLCQMIFNVCTNVGMCCTHQGERGGGGVRHKQELTQRDRKIVPHWDRTQVFEL